MAAETLIFGFELLLWLALGVAGWLMATLTRRPRASLRALLAALVAAPIGGALPGLLGWNTAPGLLCGLALAPAGALLAAWQTLQRLPAAPAPRQARSGG